MNIAFLTKDYHSGTVDAGFQAVLYLAKEYQKQGHTAVIIMNKGYATWYEPAATKKYEVVEGISIYRPYGMKWSNKIMRHFNPATPFNRVIAPVLGLAYVQRKLNIQFDVIHTQSSAPMLASTGLIAKLVAPRAKLFHTIRSQSVYGANSFKFAKLLNHLDGVIVLTNMHREGLIKAGCQAKKITLIRTGIDLEKFRKPKTSIAVLRKRHNIKEDEKVILYYGKGGPLKGVDDLIEAMNYFPKKEKVHLLLIHPNIWLENKITAVKNHKYTNKISLVIRKMDVAGYLRFADVQVLPYRSVKGTEANPLCLLEGMSAGTPIVTTDQPELKEIVKKDFDVIMAKPNNPKDLAKELLRVLHNEKLQSSLTTHAQKTSSVFSIKDVANKHLQLYTNAYK